MKKNTILLACGQALIRQSWNILLSANPGFLVVGESSSGSQTLELARELQPAVLVVDYDMPGVDATDIICHLQEAAPATRVVGITSFAWPSHTLQVLRIGAMACITRQSPISELLDAITAVLRGERYLSADIQAGIVRRLTMGKEEGQPGQDLTVREREIVRMIREGFTSPLIARRLSLSYKTVERHRYNILKKLQLKNTVALINFVNQHHLC